MENLIKISKCGFNYKSRAALYNHRKKCLECKNSIKAGAPSKMEGWMARCGDKFKTRKETKEHQSICPNCNNVKIKNIKNRQLKHNTSKEQRKIASKTAIETSKRPELLKQRSGNLKRWRIENPEKLILCTIAAQKSSKRSKFEKWMHLNLLNEFEQQVRIQHENGRRYVDFVKDKIWIEVDGPHHFFSFFKECKLIDIIEKDSYLKAECLKRRNICLIRISIKCFHNTGRMRDEWQLILNKILNIPKPGIWCLGELYESLQWAKEECTILKCPDLNTISAYLTEL